MTERPVSRSISVRQMWRTAVVCCWPGSVWESYGTGFACVRPSAQTHLSVRTRLSVSPRDEFLLTRKIARLGETKERDPNRHSAPWSASIPGVCCHRMYNPRLNRGWLPAGPDSQLNRLFFFLGNQCACQKPCLVSLHVFALFISRWQALFICGSSRTSWPRCPDSVPPTPTHLHLLFPRLVFHHLLKADWESDSVLLPFVQITLQGRGG